MFIYRNFVTILFSSFIFMACATTSRNESDLQYAHLKDSSTMGSVLGVLHSVKNNFLQTKDQMIHICVEDQTQKQSKKLLLELELTFAFWIKQVPEFDPKDWSLFRFYLRDDCLNQLQDFQFVIALFSKEKTQPPKIGNIDITIPQPTALCRKFENVGISTGRQVRVSCQTSVMLAQASAASIVIYQQNKDNKWIKSEVRTPGHLVLSKHVNWQPLDKASWFQPKDTQSFMKQYKELLNKKSRKFSDLTAFNDELARLQAKGVNPTIPKKVIEDFRNSDKETDQISFKPDVSFFHTLLHEVGHLFGLLHADAPGEDVIAGRSSTSTLNEDNQWVTKHAVMAYGEKYFHLQEDDVLGLQSIEARIRELLKQHLKTK